MIDEILEQYKNGTICIRCESNDLCLLHTPVTPIKIYPLMQMRVTDQNTYTIYNKRNKDKTNDSSATEK